MSENLKYENEYKSVIHSNRKEKTIDTINATENPLRKFSASTEQMGSGKKGKCILNLA